MHLGGAVLIVAALVAAETAPSAEPPSWMECCWSVALGGLVVVLAAATISGSVAAQIRRDPVSVRDSLREYTQLRRLHTCLWFVITSAGLLLMQWPQWIHRELRPQVMIIDQFVVLLPVLVPMFLSYAAFFEVDRVAGLALGGDAARRFTNRWSFAWWFVRHEYGLVLAPVLVLVFFRDVTVLCVGSTDGAGVWAASTAALVAVLAGFPFLMRTIWPCRPLRDTQLQQAIADECQAEGQPLPRVLQWNTRGRIVNAVMSGTVPRTHCVFLSDALVAHFSREEILAVFRHELAHARAHHVLLRVAALALPLLVLHAVGAHDVAVRAYQDLVESQATAAGLAQLAMFGLGLAAHGYWVFGGFSRLLEFEADLLSCQERHVLPSPPANSSSGARGNLTVTPCERPLARRPIDAERVNAARAALYKLGCVYGFDQRSWLHPPIGVRLRVLRAAAGRPRVGERLLTRVRRWKLGVVSGLVAAILASL